MHITIQLHGNHSEVKKKKNIGYNWKQAWTDSDLHHHRAYDSCAEIHGKN